MTTQYGIQLTFSYSHLNIIEVEQKMMMSILISTFSVNGVAVCRQEKIEKDEIFSDYGATNIYKFVQFD